MREALRWRGSNEVSNNENGNNNNPSNRAALFSRLHDQRTRFKKFTLLLVSFFLTWALSRTLQSPLKIYTPKTKGIVFKLYRSSKLASNMTIYRGQQKRRRRRLVYDMHKNSFGRYLLEEATMEDMCDVDELEVYNESLKKGDLNNVHCSLRPTKKSSGSLQLFGGLRIGDTQIDPFYVKVPIGYGKSFREYNLHTDTGSGLTWVNCKGKGKITSLGPSGRYSPDEDSFMDCREKARCKPFQADPLPCNKHHQFRCLFSHEYGDGLHVQGNVIMADVSLTPHRGPHSLANLALGCADKVNDKDAGGHSSTHLTDGLLGLGPSDASWMRQMVALKIVKDHIIAICFDSDEDKKGKGKSSEAVGILSFGNAYASRAKTFWTSNIVTYDDYGDEESMYTARLMSIKYQTHIISVKEEPPKKKKAKNKSDPPESNESGVRMGFDTGSDLTYLTKTAYKDVVEILDDDMKSKGYTTVKDSMVFVASERRQCWADDGKIIPLKEFGDLVLRFSSFGSEKTTADLAIKPQYYISSGGTTKKQRTCFNMLKEIDFDFGNVGAEIMKGHLFIFNRDLNKIGWRTIDQCTSL